MTQFHLGAALQKHKEESEITLLDAGVHTIEIVSAKSKSGAKGPTISLFGKVYNGPDAGRRVGLGSLSFSEKALWKTFPILKGLGISEDFIQQADTAADPVKVIADALVGRVADMKLIVDTWQGEERNKVDSARPAEGVSAAAPPPPPTSVSPQQSYQAPPLPPEAGRGPSF